MRALLSIKPHFVEKIFSGEKVFEFRRTTFRSCNVKLVVVYATLPVGKVVGEFSVGEIIEGTPGAIWKQTRHSAGIAKSEYDSYFHDSTVGYAIRIARPRQYRYARALTEVVPSGRAPQSFCYLV